MRRRKAVKLFLLAVCIWAGGLHLFAQNFVEPRRMTVSKMGELSDKLGDSVKAEFDKQKLAWPPQAMYLRSFKYDRQLELWVKGRATEPYRLFKTYRVCMQSGTMGPKRMEGDYQVPEGFYHINDFNPNSMFHLSLGLNYPNGSDRILSDSVMPGSNIYIHGNCVSTGCIAIGDDPMEELFYLASVVKEQGQEFIPVHVFPVNYKVRKSYEYFNSVISKVPSLAHFSSNIRTVYDYFETRRQLPYILVNNKGEYIIN
jgi:hypothetical protein